MPPPLAGEAEEMRGIAPKASTGKGMCPAGTEGLAEALKHSASAVTREECLSASPARNKVTKQSIVCIHVRLPRFARNDGKETPPALRAKNGTRLN